MAKHIEHQSDGPLKGRVKNNNLDLKGILQRTIRVKRYDGTEEWVTLVDKTNLESALLLYSCEQHFQQAADTPLGVDILQNYSA
jgi:hypothetical protein